MQGKEKLLHFYDQLDPARKSFAETFLEFLACEKEMSAIRRTLLEEKLPENKTNT